MTRNAGSTALGTAPAPEEKKVELPPEPTFTLRGRDAAADEALVVYHRLSKDYGADQAELDRIQAAITAFREYPLSIVAGREGEKDAPGSSLKPKPSDPAKPAEEPKA